MQEEVQVEEQQAHQVEEEVAEHLMVEEEVLRIQSGVVIFQMRLTKLLQKRMLMQIQNLKWIALLHVKIMKYQR